VTAALQNVGRQHCVHAKLACEFHHWQGELFIHHLTVWVQSKLATFHAKLAYEFHYWKGKLFRNVCIADPTLCSCMLSMSCTISMILSATLAYSQFTVIGKYNSL